LSASVGGGGPEGPVAARYAALVAAGTIRADHSQADLARRLDELNRRLADPTPARRRGRLARLLGAAAPPDAIRGLYIHGDVGRGKTMLMDVFYASAPVANKRRAHFNEFMGDVHDRVHAVRRANGDGDPTSAVAQAIAAEARLLCLDEFAVSDIADAMILSRLFGEMFAAGVTLVATSNTAPEELYRDGLNRGLFLPFIELLRARCDVVALDGGTDYRLEKLTAGDVYVTPLGAGATASLDATFRRLTGVERGAAAILRVKARDIRVPQAANGAARFAFADLCEAPLAAGDYLAIARTFHTLVVDAIPVIRPEQRDVAKRLILLIDSLYDHRVNLVASAAAEPGGLYRATSGDVAQAFKRTASRLIEMQSPAYLGAAHRAPAGTAETAGAALAPEHQSG
jgi:cell division protein ZapE